VSAVSATTRRYKLVVSDFHIGEGRYFKDGTRNILEDFQYDEQFITFLEYYSSGDYRDAEVELIINGDFLNLLQINYKGVYTYLMTERVVMEGMRRIIAAHQDVFRALARFAAIPGHKVSYVVGNHDQGMLFEGARRLFSEALATEVVYYDSHYEFDGVRVEHGHMHEWNSRFNPRRYFMTKGLPEPILNLPWGSIFVADVMPKIKMERSYIDKVKPFTALLAWMAIYDTMFGIRSLWKTVKFVINTLLFKYRYQFVDMQYTLTNILKDLTIYPDYDHEARRVLKDNPEMRTLIMGHTHVLRYRRFRGGQEFFNTGMWNEYTNLAPGGLGTQVMLTYAFVEYPTVAPDVDQAALHDKASLRPKVKLKEWKGHWSPVLDAAV
jgi:UDP-2,3-diacylglucosamine pyrophosphatase LpxH